MAMDSARGSCLPRLPSTDAKPKLDCAGRDAEQSGARVKGGRRKASTDEMAGTSSYQSMWPGGMVDEDEVMNDLHTKMAHIQWRKHANDKSIR